MRFDCSDEQALSLAISSCSYVQHLVGQFAVTSNSTELLVYRWATVEQCVAVPYTANRYLYPSFRSGSSNPHRLFPFSCSCFSLAPSGLLPAASEVTVFDPAQGLVFQPLQCSVLSPCTPIPWLMPSERSLLCAQSCHACVGTRVLASVRGISVCLCMSCSIHLCSHLFCVRR